MKKSYNLLEEYEWLGEFWVPQTENKMSGILSYSPKDGIKLKVTGRPRPIEDINLNTLFGYTCETGPLTIYASEISNVDTGIGDHFIDTVPCGYVIMGGFFEENEIFDKCNFRLNNFNEFCHPKDYALYAPILKNEDLMMAYKDFVMEIHQEIYEDSFYWDTSDVVPDIPVPPLDVSKIFVIDDENLKKDLNSAFIDVLTKHKKEKEELNIKKDIKYKISISSLEKKLGKEWFKEIYSFGMLLSCFMLKRIIPIEINLFKKTEKGFTSYAVLKSPYLNESQTIDVQKDQDNRIMLVNLNSIKRDFAEITSGWQEFVAWRFNIVHDTIFSHLHSNSGSCIQNYVLLMASVAQFYSKMNNDKAGEQYDWFFNTYAGDKIKDEFLKILPEGTDRNKIGKALGDIRSKIMHPASLNSWSEKKLQTMNPINIYNISELIFLTLILAIYKHIGLSEATIMKLQDNIERYRVVRSEL